MNKQFKKIVAFVFAAIATSTASAQIPQGYYDALKGKKGAELKNAVHDIIKKAKVLDYGKGNGGTWYGFWITDRTEDGRFIDRYSPENEWVQSTKQGTPGAGMNIEHSFPKSWWGGAQNQAYKDLYNLMPCESKINTAKSNYPMGVVVDDDKGNGCTKVGRGKDGKMYWEPSDEWKGDFARGYMYMATTYQNLNWKGDVDSQILEKGDYPTLKKWAYELYIKWAKQDPVNALEVKRNNDVHNIQGNRNPYVDFPNLMEYVWGDSVNYAFDPANTVTSEKYLGGGGGSTDPDTPKPGGEQIIYTVNYKTNDGDCTFDVTTDPKEGVNLWKRDKRFGWMATGAVREGDNKYPTKFAADGSLVLPEFDLTGFESAELNFNHAVNYDSEPAARLSVEVRCEGNTTKIEGINWPAGNNWVYINSGNIDLSQYVGKKIQLAFHYTSNTSVAGTWEISDIAVKGKKDSTATGIGCINTPAYSSTLDLNKPYTAYDLSGRSLSDISNAKGVVIVKQNGVTYKIVKK